MGFDFNHLIELIPDINTAFFQTIYMIAISLVVAVVIGLPVGILLFITDKGLFWENRTVQNVLGFIVNLVRSIPFIILLVALIPLTKLLLVQPLDRQQLVFPSRLQRFRFLREL